jgi:phosphatidylserine/phosphatidylglycerophosphate/cardiolipin synthase-like enzyme
VKGIINSDTTTLVYDELLLSMGSNLLVNPDTQVIMHHKFFTADAYSDSDPLVWTGSHNWSTNANTRNDENTVVVHDAAIAQLYHTAYFTLVNPIIEDTTGISIIQAGVNFKLFPSPLSSDQTLFVIPNFNGKETIEIFDLNGRKIQQNQANLISGQATSIELSNAIVSGIYFLRIGNEYLKFTIAN